MDMNPLYIQVYNKLKQHIMEGKYDPASPMPNHLVLSKQFAVSEITMRRALGKLAEEGLVVRYRGKGTFVRNDSKDNLRSIAVDSSIVTKPIYFAMSAMDLTMHTQRYFLDLISGIDLFCQANGIEFRLWDVHAAGGLPLDEECGIILMPHSSTPAEQVIQWKERYQRLMVVHFYYPQIPIPYVIVDNLTGGFIATHHLLELGHRRIGIILTGNSSLDLNQEFVLRMQGYKLALNQNGIDFDESLVRIVPGQRETEEMGEEGMKQLFSLPDPPTAVFATSDHKALGCIREAQRRGLSVPGDISIIGYDDSPIGNYLLPRLTTVNQNANQLGKRAAEIVSSPSTWMDNHTLWKDEIVPSLIIRESTAVPRT